MRFLLVLLDYFYSIATNSFDTFDEKTGILKKVLFIYLLLNPNSITPTLLLHNTTCLFTATYSPRIRDDDVNVNNKTATTGCSVLSLQERRTSGCLLTLNHVKSSSIVQRATEWIYNDQKVTTKKSENKIIVLLLLVCARRSTAINSRAHAVVSHTHTTRSNNNAYEYYEEGKSMGTYIFQAEVFLSLCGMWIRRLDVFFSRRAQTHAGARVSETSRRARNALSHELRYPTK